jgi:DNA-directed RNA polymerase specialized sigma24 family protein
VTGGGPLTSSTSPAGQDDFHERLRAIWEDPQVRKRAGSWARDPELAQDALQEAFYAVARVKDPDEIRDLRAYFWTAVMNAIRGHHRHARDIPQDDVVRLADAQQGRRGVESFAEPFEEAVCTGLQTEILLARFAAQRAALTRAIPGRSGDPARYRDVLATAAGLVLLSIAKTDVCDADGDSALAAAYPEWFAEEGLTADNAYQRFSRARADIRKILQTIVKRDELLS